MHALDVSLALQPIGEFTPGQTAVFAGRSSDRYKNAIGPFGGWIAALLLKGVLRMPGVRGVPLALDALFMGAIADDGELEVHVTLVRQNRTVGFWRSEVWQAGRICAQAQVTMSAARESMVLQDARFPAVPPPDTIPDYTVPRAPVPWIRQYLFRPVSGLIFSKAPAMDSRVWMRDADPRQLDELSLTSICDTPFPSPWIRLESQIPVSTVTYAVYYRGNAADYAAAGSDFTLLETKASLARGGYVDQFTSVWSARGALLAQTQQIIWFSDPVKSDT